MLTQEAIREILEYAPETGVFTWTKRRSLRVLAGHVAGSKSKRDGYVRLFINGKSHLAHRLAWLLATGSSPAHEIDHINGDRADNRLSNLREVSKSVNIQNQRKAKADNLSSGMLGVSYDARMGKYRSAITLNLKRRHLGYFQTAAEAHQTYLDEKRKVHAGCTI